jgi:hypothetical protein|tara:strand:- start:453 stop:926 length:474 start_codon:yes stop_codon:yes gene_type:complete
MSNLSAEVLQTLGFKMSRDVLSDDNISCEKKLWRSVLTNAVEDTLIINSDRKNSLIKLKAHNWILDTRSNFDEVCTCADIDSASVISSYKKALNNRIVRFTKRQLMWHKYNKMYRQIGYLDSLEAKKKLRRETKKLREEILTTPNYFVTTVFTSKII